LLGSQVIDRLAYWQGRWAAQHHRLHLSRTRLRPSWRIACSRLSPTRLARSEAWRRC